MEITRQWRGCLKKWALEDILTPLDTYLGHSECCVTGNGTISCVWVDCYVLGIFQSSLHAKDCRVLAFNKIMVQSKDSLTTVNHDIPFLAQDMCQSMKYLLALKATLPTFKNLLKLAGENLWFGPLQNDGAKQKSCRNIITWKFFYYVLVSQS